MKWLFILLSQLGWMTPILASDQEGYVLKTSGDTLHGTIDVETKRMGGEKELSLGEMEFAISFTEAGGKTKRIRASDVAGYGFLYEGSWYHFVVLDMEKNAWKKNQGMGERKINHLSFFIHRVYDGPLVIYKDYFKYVGGMMAKPTLLPTRAAPYGTELFIRNPDLGFIEVSPERPNDSKKLKEFLLKYLSLEEAFLTTVEEKAKFSDAETIFLSYNEWKKKN
ncbi:MAG: hypothetical protein ABIT05_02300 [Chitinophagaceae bacterium]